MIRRPFRILVVDDETDVVPLITQRMRSYIRSREFVFSFACDGVDALEILSKDDCIDLVVTDINMPKMDGLTLLERLDTVGSPVAIVMSAYGDMRNIRRAMNLDAFDFVTKPIDFNDFEQTIKRARTHIEKWKEAIKARDELIVMQSELELAVEIQASVVPTVFPGGKDFEIAGSVKSAMMVSGDFLDVIPKQNSRLGLGLADVSGKGISAALYMMRVHTILKSAAIGLDSPGEVLGEVNERLLEGNSNFMFATVLYVVYDWEDGAFVYANGGHCNPFVIHVDGSCTELPSTRGVVLGLSNNFTYAQGKGILKPGESLFLYSDGLIEARTPQGEAFGVERLKTAFVETPLASAAQIHERAMEVVAEFVGGASQHDDITCLVLQRRSAGNR